VEVQAYQRYSVSGLYCIDLERRLRRRASLRDRKVPGRKRVVVAPKGARLKGADVGVERLLAGPDRWSEQHRGGWGGGPQGRGPSAALGSVASEEPQCGSDQTSDEESLEQRDRRALL